MADTSSLPSTRLNRFLASAGIGSRRACDEMILDGEIRVNGKICLAPGTQVTEQDHVKVGGKRVEPLVLKTILFNKPRGYVCTKADEKKRETVYDLIPPALHHLNHVGRLDAETEGLLILTNDGDLSQRLAHPRTKVEKEYLVTLNQAYSNEEMDRLLKGIRLPEGFAKAAAVMRVSPRRIRIVLTTGLKRQIRGMFLAIGCRVTKLVRLRIGSLWGGDLAIGRHEELTPERIQQLMSNPKLEKGFRTKPLAPSPEQKREKSAGKKFGNKSSAKKRPNTRRGPATKQNKKNTGRGKPRR